MTALPHFAFLVKDRVWSVRRAAAEVLHSLLDAFPRESNVVDLHVIIAQYYTQLAADASPFVRCAAKASLGAILSHLNASTITENMIYDYVCTSLEAARCSTTPPEASAGSFITVARKLGSDKWDCLRDLFIAFSHSESEHVLISITSSVHQLADLLPSDAFRRDVFPFLIK